MNASTHTSLHAHNIRLGYGPKHTVLRNAEISVNQGEIVGLVGPNGAGKTTLFRALIGDLPPQSGSITLHTPSRDPIDITHLGLSARARLGIGYLPQQPALLWNLSALDNLRAALSSPATQRHNHHPPTDLQHIIELFSISPFLHNRADQLSGGQTRRLELARLAALQPSILLCDEPFNGLDPEATQTLSKHIQSLASHHNTGILITDHRIQTLQSFCTRFVAVEHATTQPGLPSSYQRFLKPTQPSTPTPTFK